VSGDGYYYRERLDRWAVEAENARVRRLAVLDEALEAVRDQDRDVMSPEELGALNAAAIVVSSLRRTW
jgi:hypothetical protein